MTEHMIDSYAQSQLRCQRKKGYYKGMKRNLKNLSTVLMLLCTLEETSIVNFFDQLSLDLPDKLIHLVYSRNTPNPTEDGVNESNSDPIIGLLKTFSRFENSREVFLSITGTISTICRCNTFSEEDDDSIQGFSQPLIGSGFILVMVEILSIVICDKKIISSGRICFMKKYSGWNSSLERIVNLDNEKMQKIEIIDEQESKMICDSLGEFALNFGFDQVFESGELEKEIEVTKELLTDHFGDEEELKKILRSSRFLIYAMNQFNQWEETGSIDSLIHIDEEVLIEALEDSDTNMIQAGIFIILSSSVLLIWSKASRSYQLEIHDNHCGTPRPGT
ncbi:uncharacterized protein MELLADRAFT_113102 [Melampsora larici-populina 98AG31]|uniref:Uncharacterized protein n=1 Tax=Melampsora larici-populina (strain 98AG31 / pathotype 3-4-7) TaxID=747676 RepID=F4S8R1_MELLP|nr:uncharacterized protein MELLADRAFT_113102 [Melampsora larici-populina 98AG31]EGF98940.1 hypothetical protein MELLADRAFT_113102 [Melampsora larici-populina 98AG31]